jgi:hypothetical protein
MRLARLHRPTDVDREGPGATGPGVPSRVAVPRQSEGDERRRKDVFARNHRPLRHARPLRANGPEHAARTVATSFAPANSGLPPTANGRMAGRTEAAPIVPMAAKMAVGRHRVRPVVNRSVVVWRPPMRMDKVAASAIDETSPWRRGIRL